MRQPPTQRATAACVTVGTGNERFELDHASVDDVSALQLFGFIPTWPVTATFISADDHVAAKLAAGRPQDIADVAVIRKAATGKL